MNMKKTQLATFGAGCFWGVEEVFRTTKGVIDTMVGYEGGHTDKPTYEEVCTNKTGHAEVVRIEYDPSVVSYEDLLLIFWDKHDPTQLNRQGSDVGTQYRSVIFYHNKEQRKAAEKSKKELSGSGKYKDPIVTEIIKAAEFCEAEEYHQKYLMKRGLNTCDH